MSTESLELSKRLEELAEYHDGRHLKYVRLQMMMAAARHYQWAADIRSIVIPQPIEPQSNVPIYGGASET